MRTAASICSPVCCQYSAACLHRQYCACRVPAWSHRLRADPYHGHKQKIESSHSLPLCTDIRLLFSVPGTRLLITAPISRLPLSVSRFPFPVLSFVCSHLASGNCFRGRVELKTRSFPRLPSLLIAINDKLHIHDCIHILSNILQPEPTSTLVKHGAIFAPSWPRPDPCLSFQRRDTPWLIRH